MIGVGRERKGAKRERERQGERSNKEVNVVDTWL